MNITVLSIVILILLSLVFGFFKYLINAFINDDKLIYIIRSLLCLITFIIGLYSFFNYIGSISDPIENGVFRDPIFKGKINHVKIKPPVIELKYPTDKEIYEQQVEQFN